MSAKSTIVNNEDIQVLLKLDPIFSQIHSQYGLPPDVSRAPGFVSLAKIILEQQVSLASAVAHFRKLQSHMGDFTPENILKMSDEELRACHISRQKSSYLRGLSASISDGKLDLDTIHLLPDEEIRTTLKSLKGIGDWTTDVYMMFCLGSKDIFPIGDIALVNTLKELFPITNREEMLTFSERWKPLRSLATQFLWHHYLRKRNRSFPFEHLDY